MLGVGWECEVGYWGKTIALVLGETKKCGCGEVKSVRRYLKRGC